MRREANTYIRVTYPEIVPVNLNRRDKGKYTDRVLRIFEIKEFGAIKILVKIYENRKRIKKIRAV